MKRENEKKNKKQGQRQEKTLNLANPMCAANSRGSSSIFAF